MKEKGIVDNLMHFFVHNSNLVAVVVLCAVHVVLLATTAIAGVTPLVLFNILSVAGIIMPIYISTVLEVTAYACVSTYFIGLRCGTYCFLFAIVPIIIYFGCFLFKGIKRVIIAVLLVLNFATFAVLYICLTNRNRYLTYPPAYACF